MSVSAISLSNLKNLQQKLEANQGASYEEQAQLVKDLFSKTYYNSGSESKADLQNQIKTLESRIKILQVEANLIYEQLRTQNQKINKAQEELTDKLTQVASASETYTQKQYDSINKAVELATEMYKNGEISKEEIPSKIAALIEGTNPEGAARIRNLMAGADEKSSEVKMLINNLTSLFNYADTKSGELAASQASLELLELLSNKISDAKGGYTNNNNDASVPVYTPKKEAFVDECVAQYRVAASGDIYSMANPQTQKFSEALGINGGESYLKQMKEQGFTYKEAMYATTFIFNQVGIKYVPGGQLSVPYGHGADAKNAYTTFIDQVKLYWGEDASRADGTGEGGNGGETDVPVIEPNRTDPIGFNSGNVTYDFAIDRNNDNIFNGKEEFLGADKGIQELFALDINNDGKVSTDEMEDLYVVKNNHELGDFGFISAQMAGISEIDLNSFKENNYTNVNGNILAGTFNITVNGKATEGRQTLDNDHYLDVAYGGGFGEAYTISLSDAETKAIYDKFNQDNMPITQNDIDTLKANAQTSVEEIITTKAKISDNESSIREEKNAARDTEVQEKEDDENDKKKQILNPETSVNS